MAFDVLVTRLGQWWLVEVPELQAMTQTRLLADVEQRARLLVADLLDISVSRVRLGSALLGVRGEPPVAIGWAQLAALGSLPSQRGGHQVRQLS